MLLKILGNSFAAALVLVSGLSTAQAESKAEQVLEVICEVTSTRFVDAAMNGLDWDSACKQAKQRIEEGESLSSTADELLNRLGLSHTRYFDPSDPNLSILSSVYREAPHIKGGFDNSNETPLLRGAGFLTFEAENSRFVGSILDGSPAHAAGLQIGDEIVDDGGATFQTVWTDSPSDGPQETSVVIRRNRGSANQTVPMKLITADALSVLAEATEESVRVVERHEKRIGYVRGWTMLSRDDIGGPRVALERAIADGRFANIDALVFDARGLVGGGGLDFLDSFFAPSNLSLSFKPRENDWIDVPSLPEKTPLTIIIGAQTRSSAEIMAYVAKRRGLATLVGQKTAGFVAGGRFEILPNNGGLYVGVGRIRIEGEELEGVGVLPDIETDTVRPFGAGMDPAFERALDLAAMTSTRRDGDVRQP